MLLQSSPEKSPVWKNSKIGKEKLKKRRKYEYSSVFNFLFKNWEKNLRAGIIFSDTSTFFP